MIWAYLSLSVAMAAPERSHPGGWHEGMFLTKQSIDDLVFRLTEVDVEIEVLLTFEEGLTRREQRQLWQLDRHVHTALDRVIPYVIKPELLVHDRLSPRMRLIEHQMVEEWFWAMGAGFDIKEIKERLACHP